MTVVKGKEVLAEVDVVDDVDDIACNEIDDVGVELVILDIVLSADDVAFFATITLEREARSDEAACVLRAAETSGVDA